MLFSIFRGRSLLPVCFSLSSRRPLRCAKNGASLLSSALSTLYSQRRTRRVPPRCLYTYSSLR